MRDVPPNEPPPSPPEIMLRVHFDPATRRQGLVSRLLELRTLIPQFEEEKARIEGMVTLLDEISPPQPEGPVMTESDGPPEGLGDTEDGPNGRPKG